MDITPKAHREKTALTRLQNMMNLVSKEFTIDQIRTIRICGKSKTSRNIRIFGVFGLKASQAAGRIQISEATVDVKSTSSLKTVDELLLIKRSLKAD